jgi:uncharacterized glyoxalase superfamily protein PhnB
MVEAKESNVTEVTAHIVVRDAARAADWYERALGARTGVRVPVPDGRFMQIELVFGDSRVLIADEFPEFGAVSPLTLGGTYGALTITTDAVDELWERALAEGARSTLRCRTHSGASRTDRSWISSGTGGACRNTSRTFRRTSSCAARRRCSGAARPKRPPVDRSSRFHAKGHLVRRRTRRYVRLHVDRAPARRT